MPVDTAIPEVLREGREGPQEAFSGTRSMEIAPPPEKSPPDAPPDAPLTLLAQYRDIQGKLAEHYGPQIAEAEQAIRGAERKASDVAERVVKPGIEGVRAAASVPVPPLPQMAPEPPVPSQQARPFLAGTKDPLMSVINGLGLLAQLAMAGAAPVAALGALTGAMNGWAKGDQERAEKDWREYLQVVDRVRHENRQSLQVWEAAMQASGANQAQAQARYAADMAELGLADRGVATAGQDMTRTLGMLTMERSLVDGLFGKTLDVMRLQAANRVAEETRKQTAEFTRERLEETRRHNLETEAQRERESSQRAKDEAGRLEEKRREFDEKRGDKRASEAAEAASFTPESLEFIARQYYVTGQLPPMGMGKASTEARTKILNRAAAIAREAGTTGEDQAARSQLSKGLQTELNRALGQRGVVMPYARTFDYNLKVAEDLSEKVERTGAPLINKPMLAGQKNIRGDVNVAKFDAAVQTVVNEYSKVMSGSGQGSDESRRHAAEMLSTALTKDQFRGVAETLRNELEGRMKGYADSIAGARDALKAMSPSASGGKPGSKSFTLPDGTKVTVNP